MLNSLVMHHIPNDQVYTIIMLCQILGNQVYAIREVDIWRRALKQKKDEVYLIKTSKFEKVQWYYNGNTETLASSLANSLFL